MKTFEEILEIVRIEESKNPDRSEKFGTVKGIHHQLDHYSNTQVVNIFWIQEDSVDNEMKVHMQKFNNKLELIPVK